MPKSPTYPTLYDECKQISISSLKRLEYLNPSQWKSGTINWSVGEGEHKEITGRIDISVSTHSESPYLELNYTCNGTPINYKVQLVSIPSNIGKGIVWYFICPHTGKRCRKLYLVGERFLHRAAFRGCFYEKQIRSKRWRLWNKVFSAETITEQMYSRYFKKHYNGKPTKRYLKLQRKLHEPMSENDLELLKGISPN